MIIRDFAASVDGRARVSSAAVSWEENDYPEEILFFEIQDGDADDARAIDEPSWDAFVAACFPLAAVHGEARLRIEGRPCPMLIEGLLTAHAWWQSWGGMAGPAPAIETLNRGRSRVPTGPRQALSFFVGWRRRFPHAASKPAALPAGGRSLYPSGAVHPRLRYREAGARPRARAIPGGSAKPRAFGSGSFTANCTLPHQPASSAVQAGLLGAPAGRSRLGCSRPCRCGRFYLPVHRWDIPLFNPVPAGSHAAVDPLFSSQLVTIIHDGSRFSRLEKVRELASWPMALDALRVCPGNTGGRANCGSCEKCLRTRLELLAAGIESTAAFGPSLMPAELWDHAVPAPIGDRALRYAELLPFLRSRGLDELCRVLEAENRRISTSATAERVIAGTRRMRVAAEASISLPSDATRCRMFKR